MMMTGLLPFKEGIPAIDFHRQKPLRLRVENTSFGFGNGA
jgi:hypothetical protein